MATVTIPSSDSITYNDFIAGNSVQLRAVATEKDVHDYDKGKTVKVVYQDGEANGKIVSDPLVIRDGDKGGKKEISLIVEKA